MSFPVAFRSAVFYFVACTPCTKARNRQKVKNQAKKERLEKAKLETEQPDLYRHPSPFNTNPYWEQEISMGPSLPKKNASKNSSQRGLTSAGHESNPPSVSEHTTAGEADSHINAGDSTTTISKHDGVSISDDWNRRHGYQREDEELWGQWSGHRLMDAFSKARDSAGRLIDSMRVEKEVTEQERREFYFSPRNPPVNDYHPPVVSSKAPNKLAHKWMLQPPPPAKVMEGKVPVGRTMSSTSKSSSRTLLAEEVPLGRMVPEKLLKDKLKRENSSPTEDELIESLFATRSTRSSSFRRTRSMSLDGISFEESEESLSSPLDRRRSRLAPVAAPPGFESEGDSEDEDRLSPRRARTGTMGSGAGHAAQRPKLATIRSSSTTGGSRRSKTGKRPRSNLQTLSDAVSPVGDDSDW